MSQYKKKYPISDFINKGYEIFTDFMFQVLKRNGIGLMVCENKIEDAVYLIADDPTLDAVPVVRCKDCKNWETDWSLRSTNDHFCAMIDNSTSADFFCADGERKDGADNETL